MDKDVKKFIIEELDKNIIKDEVSRILKDKDGDIELTRMPPNTILTALEELGVEVLHHTYDTNGWQCDWYIRMTYDEIEYGVGGNAYNGTCSFDFE
jgi:hypothetical protein